MPTLVRGVSFGRWRRRVKQLVIVKDVVKADTAATRGVSFRTLGLAVCV
jgi:hypothetical protein